VLREYRFATAPKWVVGHLIVLAIAVTMVLLGRWQLDVSNAKHFSLQNFGYALQWWAFTVFGIGMWLRIMRDAAHHNAATDSAAQDDAASAGPQPAEPTAAAPEPVAYRRYVMPQSADGPAPAADSEHAAYNEYLAGLADKPADKETR
jgi:DNA-binding transcriptional regulator of glucitol operon